jgi:FkbM family methyltransferase
MKIFVDVGAHYGETLDVALDPRWGFDLVFCLEPSSDCISILKSFHDTRIVVQQLGLSGVTTSAVLYGAGELGASLHPDKKFISNPGVKLKQELISIRRASEWFKENIPENSKVFLKINCEGCECEILSDLLDSGVSSQICSLYVDFDVRKIERLAHLQGVIESRLQNEKVDYITPEMIGSGGNKAVSVWLSKCLTQARSSSMAVLRYKLRMYAPMYIQFTMLVSALLPQRLYWWLGHRFGRVARNRKSLSE